MIDIIIWMVVVVIVIATVVYTLSIYQRLKKETIRRIKSNSFLESNLQNSRIRFQLRGSVRLFNDLLIDRDDLHEYSEGLPDLP